MIRTDRNKCQHTKQEIVKPQRTGDNFACQTFAYLPTLGLTIALTGLLTINSFGQVPVVQIPTFDKFMQVPQPTTPNQNNNLIQNFNQTIPTTTGIEQLKKDQLTEQSRQHQLQEIHYETNKPSTRMINVRYDLPSCSSVSGASAYQTAFSDLSKMASDEKVFNVKEANFIVENAYFENQGKFESFDNVIKQITQFLNWKMDDLGYNKNSNLSKNLTWTSQNQKGKVFTFAK